MKDMSKFQLIFTGVFAGFLVVGVLMFALYKSSGGESSTPVWIWGTMSKAQFDKMLLETALNREVPSINYVQKNPDTFEIEFLEALASGSGPDVVFLRQDEILKHRNKIYPIPYANVTERDFKDRYVQEADLFLSPAGILAMPITIDPYVMYWNRTIFENASIPVPPKYWDEFLTLTQTLTKRDGTLNISQATIGFGEFRNVSHAKDIIALLIMQAGSPIAVKTSGGNVVSVFSDRMGLPISPAEAAINFFTEFSNPAKTIYTWNRSLPESKEAFIAGDVAVYFGPASEYAEIKAKNPNLNFDVTFMPQSRDAENKITFAEMGALALVKNSKNIGGGFATVLKLTEPAPILSLAKMQNLPPVRRDLLNYRPEAAAAVVFYQSSLLSRAWLDPNNAKTDKIFMDMIESITGGRTQSGQAISRADSELRSLFQALEQESAAITMPATGQ